MLHEFMCESSLIWMQKMIDEEIYLAVLGIEGRRHIMDILK